MMPPLIVARTSTPGAVELAKRRAVELSITLRLYRAWDRRQNDRFRRIVARDCIPDLSDCAELPRTGTRPRRGDSVTSSLDGVAPVAEGCRRTAEGSERPPVIKGPGRVTIRGGEAPWSPAFFPARSTRPPQ